MDKEKFLQACNESSLPDEAVAHIARHADSIIERYTGLSTAPAEQGGTSTAPADGGKSGKGS